MMETHLFLSSQINLAVSHAGDLYRIMSEEQKNQLCSNIAGGLKQANESIQQRMLEQFRQADPDYADRVAGFF